MTRKKPLNITVDPDIHAEAKEVFAAMDVSMSAFVEMQLALFLESVRPLKPILLKVKEEGKSDAEVKTALRKWLAHSHKMVGGSLAEFGGVTGEIAELLEK